MQIERPFTIGSACHALGITIQRFKNMRRRDQLPFVDAAPEAMEAYRSPQETSLAIEADRALSEENDRSGWIRYSIEEIALLSAQIELVDVLKLDVTAASRLLANARGTFEGQHPERPLPFADIWIGAVISDGEDNGRAHVGGTLEDVQARVQKHIAAPAAEDDGAPCMVLTVNLSKHVRRVRAALAERA